MTLAEVLNRLMQLRSYYGSMHLIDVSEWEDEDGRESRYIHLDAGERTYTIDLMCGSPFYVTEHVNGGLVETANAIRLHGLLLNKKRNEAGELA